MGFTSLIGLTALALLTFNPVAIVIVCVLYGQFFISTTVTFPILSSIAIGIVVGIIIGSISSIASSIRSSIFFGIIASIAFFLAANVRQDILFGITSGLLVGFITYLMDEVWTGLIISIVIGLSIGFLRGVTLHLLTSTIEMSFNVTRCAAISGTFAFACLFVVYRLYLPSVFSMLSAYHAARKNPSQVFSFLRHSSLHWKQRSFYPLPKLKEILQFAAVQSIEQTLMEVAFIIEKKSQQIEVAQEISLEIALADLETRESLRDIAHAWEYFSKTVSRDAILIDSKWVAPLTHFYDVSRNAARARSPLGWQAKHNALDAAIKELEEVDIWTAFKDEMINMRLKRVATTWLGTVRRELETLDQAPEKTVQISNPYSPGYPLERGDSLFVGRRDLAQQLDTALSKERNRPTFILNGSRRMGKSTALRQLPDLLGSRYGCAFFDLQMRGTSSSTAAFLGEIAEEIYKLISIQGIATRKTMKLDYEQLLEASRVNDANVYHRFNRWFKDVEHILKQKDRVILLAFDEFEKLQEAQDAGYLDLRLLLDWFRSVIQNSPQIALLFSGAQTLGEMGKNWSGYFINVRTLKVGVLQPEEARELITRPTPDFPSEHIFGDNVVEEIIRFTGCHPFFLQGVCSALMDHLNSEGRLQCKINDVEQAVERFFVTIQVS